LYSAVKRRRRAFADTSVSGAGWCSWVPFFIEHSGLALYTKLPGVRCLTHVGIEGHADASAPRPVPPDSSLQPDAPAHGEPPTEIRPVDPDKWAQAPQSPGRRIGLELPECIADKGCPFTPFALPPCPPGQEFVEIADAIAAVDGRMTVVRGTVWDNRLILAYDCEPRCCRGKDPPRPLLIRSFGTPPRTGMSLTLVHTNLPYALSCQEDESATCCAMEVETTVLAYGTIRMRERRIEDPRLCRFAGP
jgi:hypothetical protein